MRRKERKEAKIGVFDENDKTRKKSPVYPPLEFPEVDGIKLDEIKNEIKNTAKKKQNQLIFGFMVFVLLVIAIILLLSV